MQFYLRYPDDDKAGRIKPGIRIGDWHLGQLNNDLGRAGLMVIITFKVS